MDIIFYVNLLQVLLTYDIPLENGATIGESLFLQMINFHDVVHNVNSPNINNVIKFCSVNLTSYHPSALRDDKSILSNITVTL